MNDEAEFAVLEAYLEELHAGRQPDRVRLLAEHPELAEMVSCLDSLDRLAAPPTAGRDQAADSHDATALFMPTLAATGPPQELHELLAPVPRFGNYDLLGELGRGGMGVVYKARQRDLDRLVAIKMILASNLATSEQIQRFHAEARAAARLHHPNIVQVHEAGQQQGQHYFVMEHVEGASLAAALAGRPAVPEDAARVLAAVARAVDYLHRQGIIHRDLKPSNVLLSTSSDRRSALGPESANELLTDSRQPNADGRWPIFDCTPKLTDFGLVKMLEGSSDVTRTGAIMGTPSYMAPEQAAGRHRDVGPQSDVYSLGAMLYEMLTGRPPFRAATPLDTLVQVIESEPRLPRQVEPTTPIELELVCMKCLEKNPEKRYSSAGALADDLERYLRQEAVEARPQGLGQRLWRWARREPALASRLAALLVFAVLLHTVYLVTPHVSLGLHVSVLGLLGLWAVASYVLQRAQQSESWTPAARCASAATDALLLTLVLWLTDNAGGPLVGFYALMIAGSGLWFRVRLVWVTTLAAVLGYLLLTLLAWLRGVEVLYPHHQLIFVAALVVLGFIMAYQVERVRVLSRYYEHRPLP